MSAAAIVLPLRLCPLNKIGSIKIEPPAGYSARPGGSSPLAQLNASGGEALVEFDVAGLERGGFLPLGDGAGEVALIVKAVARGHGDGGLLGPRDEVLPARDGSAR